MIFTNVQILAATLLIFVCGCGKQQNAAASNKPSNGENTSGEVLIPAAQQVGVIESRVIEPRTVAAMIRVPGKITLPDNGSWRVGAITSGRIEDVEVSQGDYVHKGQLLARMHSHDVHEVKAEYLTAIADRSRLQAAEALAKKNYERTVRLYDLKAASVEEMELARQQWINAQTTRQNSEVAVQRERAHLEDNLGIPASAKPN
jgi:cobalt-zinc-cadmium efflux system membrane fusion protein